MSKKLRIVIIDDKQDLAQMYADALAAEGHEVLVFAHGDEAVGALVERNADIVLCDMIMPEQMGVTVIETIRQRMKEKVPPIVMLTSMSSEYDREYALQKGAVAFWNKNDVDVSQLSGMVKSIVDTN